MEINRPRRRLYSGKSWDASAGSAVFAPLCPGRTTRSGGARLGAGDHGRSSRAERSALTTKRAPSQTSPTAPVEREAAFVEDLRLAVGRRGQRADEDRGARAILLEGGAIGRHAQRLALGQRGDAADPVAGRVGIARGGRIAIVAVGGQPLLGVEGVEALADDFEPAVGVAHRGQIARGRDNRVVARTVERAENAERSEGNRHRAKQPAAPQNRAHHRKAEEGQREGREGAHVQRRAGRGWR